MNDTYYYTIVSVFAIVIALVIIDPNFGTWIDLQTKVLGVNVRRYYMMATMWPRIKYNHWQMQRALKKIRKEYNLPEDSSNGDV